MQKISQSYFNSAGQRNSTLSKSISLAYEFYCGAQILSSSSRTKESAFRSLLAMILRKLASTKLFHEEIA
jgi:hypothetical protein